MLVEIGRKHGKSSAQAALRYLLQRQALEIVRQSDVLVIDGSALREFPVPNLMQAYQGHKLVLVNTAPLVFDARAGIVVRGHSFTDIFQQIQV